jgi:hypothetical protein
MILGAWIAPGAATAARHALLIGINEYLELPDLRGAANDVERMRGLLIQRYGFEPENVTVLLNEQATRQGILTALDDLGERVGPEDTVWIHYSGHGSQVPDGNGDEEDGLDETICPHDARTEGVADITDDEFDGRISRLNVAWVVATLDSCHSGTALRSIESDLRPRMVPPDSREALYMITTRAVVPLSAEENYLLFTGAASHEPALDGPFSESGEYHGLFTHAFAESLGSAGPDTTAREIMQGVEQELDKIRQRLAGRPLPEPQLEGRQEFLDRPLLPGADTAEDSKSGAPRLGFVEAVTLGPDRARLRDAVPLGARPGSTWALHAPDETEFGPGSSLAMVRVEGVEGSDALARRIAGQLPPSGARAVRTASAPRPPTLSLSGLSAQTDESVRRRLSSLLEGAALVLPPGERGDFDVRCVAAGERSRCRVTGAVGAPANRQIDAPTADLAHAIADTMARSVALEALAGLENEASRIQLAMRKSGSSGPREQPIGTRSVVLNASVTPATLRFYQRGTPRTTENSLQLEIETNETCYLTLVELDAGGSAHVLFPNSIQKSDFHPGGRIEPGRVVRVPDSLEDGNRAGFYFDFGPPAGAETFYAYCMADLEDANRLRASLGGIRTRSTHAIDSALGLRSAAIDLSQVYARGVILEPSEDPAENAASRTAAAPRSDSVPTEFSGDWTSASITLEVGP